MHLSSLKTEDSVSPLLKRSAPIKPRQAVLLVGGFGESPWLFQRLRSRLERLGLPLSRPDVPTCAFPHPLPTPINPADRNKAVAQGAIAFFLDGIVKGRVSHFKCGVRVSTPYNPYDPQHAERSSQAVYMADGIKRLPGAFSTILDEVRSTVHLFSPHSHANVPGSPCFRNTGVPETLLLLLGVTTEPKPNLRYYQSIQRELP